MQTGQESIKLLILDVSQNAAEELVNLLRNAGHATQAQMVESETHLSDLLNHKTWDLCFANDQAEIGPQDVLGAIRQLELDIPVIMLCENYDSDKVVEALSLGITDVAPYQARQQLLLVALRELANLNHRRAQRKAEISLREAEKRCRLLLENSKDAIAYVHDGMHIYANSAYVKLFGYADFDELEGMPLMDMVVSADQDSLKSFLRAYNKNNEQSEFNCRGMRDDDGEFEAVMSFSSARYDGEPCTQIVVRSATTANAAKDALHQDIITGLQTPQAFYDQIESAIKDAVENAKKSLLIYVQPDDFVPLKNRLGMSNTNFVLGDIARILRQHIQNPSQLARVNDFNFAIILSGAETGSAEQLALKIREAISLYEAKFGGEAHKVTASVGLTVINETSSSAADVIAKAQGAANIAQKQDSGEAIHLHANNAENLERAQHVVSLLRSALEKKLFRIVFQPIVSLRGDSGEHYEVLLRMPDEEGNEISPAEFLREASNQGLTRDIDRWVIEESARKLGEHLNKGHKTHIFVNVTAESIRDASLLPWLGDILNQVRIPGERLIFQISETDSTSYLSEAKSFVKGINELQCRAALTHFGRALNPFNTLKHLNVSFVKIDGSFVTELSKSDDSKEELKTLVSSLHTQGKLTIAPLVDTASLLSVLWQAGINYIQGYYIQQPGSSMDYDFSTEDDEV